MSRIARLLQRDGKSLSADEDAKERRKMDKLAAERREESPSRRERRIAKAREDRRKQRAFLQEIPTAYTFQMAGDTVLNGRPAWIVDAIPIPGYQPKDPRARLLTKFKGRFFFAKNDATVLKLEAQAFEPMSFGWVVARLDRGARFTMETTFVNGELWMPSRLKIDFDARFALFKKLRVDVQIDYGNFRKFQADSHLIVGETPEQ